MTELADGRPVRFAEPDGTGISVNLFFGCSGL